MRRFLFVLAIAALAVGASGPAQAATVPFTGSMSVQIGTLPAVPFPGGGTATVNGSGGTAPITGLTIPAGAFATKITAPIPNAFPIIQIKLASSLGEGDAANGTIVLNGGTCTAGHPNVNCPGGGLAGFGGISGSAFVGIFSTHTTGSGTGPVANLSVPLNVVGGGSTVMTTGQGIEVTVSGAGWTTGTAQVINPSGTRQVHLTGSTTATAVTQTTMTFTGSGTASAVPGNQLTLVSPVQVFNTATSAFTPSLASIRLQFVPEPGTLLLLGSGVAGLALYGRRRMRR